MQIPKIDSTFKIICLGCAALAGLLTVGFLVQLGTSSTEAWREFGWGFLFSREWDPVADRYGALPSLTGTVLTTIIALVFAIPLAFWAAMFLVDARPVVSGILSQAVDLLAAIPSVIYGMWGLFVLAPMMQKHIQPFLIDALQVSKIPWLGKIIGTEHNGFGLLTAGLILAIMILPYMCAVMRDVFRMTPPLLKEAAYGLGCTKCETTKDVVLRYGIRGILGGVFIGLWRALGETMAVMFVIGNQMTMPKTLFSGASTIPTTLANNFSEADGLQRSSLFALGLILLLLCLGIQFLSQYYLHATKQNGDEL